MMGLKDQMYYLSKGAIHYLTKNEIEDNKNYLKDQLTENKEYFAINFGWSNKTL